MNELNWLASFNKIYSNFRGFFDHNGYEDQEATRQERITTDEDISAIRAIDVSGQNGEAVFSSYSPRSVVLVFSSDGAGRGFNFSVEVYANRNTDGDNGAGSKSISMIWIAISMVVGVISLTKF